ncbi:MAG: YdcF family protein [Rhodospirillaceae bacterium]|nr:YdcF family protein [Rhodospirillaceae bacterium]
MTYTILKSLLLPPASLFVAILAGWFLRRRFPGIGAALAGFGIIMMYGLSTPIVGSALLASLEDDAHRAEIAARATVKPQAIVILGGDTSYDAPDNAAQTVGPLTLTRLRYGARLHRETSLPVLVTGGRARDGMTPVGELMRRSLELDFRIPVRWVEERSTTTMENARRSAEHLRRDGINAVYLVTHTWHLPRALYAFQQTGLQVAPYGADRTMMAVVDVTSFLPSARAAHNSYYAVHERLGLIWYRLKGAFGA